MNDKQLFAVLLTVIGAALVGSFVSRIHASRSRATHTPVTRLTDATTWEVRLNDIAVATIREHAVVEIERRLNREWWRGALTAISEFGTFVWLGAVSVVTALAIEAVFIVFGIQGDPLGAGHALHAVFSASEIALQTGWSAFWQIVAMIAFMYFVLALMFGVRRRAHDYVAEAWWTNIRRAARVASDGNLALVLTEADRLGWRSPHRVDWARIDRPSH